MPYPKQVEIELPLLRAIERLGGRAKPQDVYPLVAEQFPELTHDELTQTLENHPSTRKWWNLVQWVRQRLVEAGQLDGTTRGIWALTDAGRSRLKSEPTGQARGAVAVRPKAPAHLSEVSLRDLANTNRDEVKRRILSELRNLTPVQFEYFCKVLLQQLGFESLHVTRRTADGGIDGYGDFRQGAVSLKSAFQAKRWTDNAVGRPEIDKFRGAIQGEFDHGVFLTTSRFSSQAIEASYRKGAISILLLDAAAIMELMVDRGIGVVRQPIYLYEVDPGFFAFDET